MTAKVIPFRRPEPKQPPIAQKRKLHPLRWTSTRQRYLAMVGWGRVMCYPTQLFTYESPEDKLPTGRVVWMPIGGGDSRALNWLAELEIRPLWRPSGRPIEGGPAPRQLMQLTLEGRKLLIQWNVTKTRRRRDD